MYRTLLPAVPYTDAKRLIKVRYLLYTLRFIPTILFHEQQKGNIMRVCFLKIHREIASFMVYKSPLLMKWIFFQSVLAVPPINYLLLLIVCGFVVIIAKIIKVNFKKVFYL